ncbi:MAG: isochorismate synthase [Flavobacteriaceae bacterium]
MILTSLIQQLKTQFEQSLPFVIYRKPQCSNIEALLQQNDVLYQVNDYSESGFVMAPFSGTPVLIPLDKATSLFAEYTAEKQLQNSSVAYTVNESAKILHEQLVTKGIAAIESGAFEKVVLSRAEVIEIESFDWTDVFFRMLDLYPTAFAYCFYHPKVGMWLGAFGEQLVRYSKGQLNTMAVAGTQLFQENVDPVWGEKEKQEQQLVTDFILDGLRTYSSKIEQSEPYSVSAGRLWHIRTDIQAQIEENQLKNIIEFLHPTPAVCGFPKDSAHQFILENEGYDRSYYAGFLGELNMNQTTDLFVNLRCMQVIDKHQVVLYVGGGITADSIPEKEWQETVHKAQTMKMVL